ncbi:FxsA family protein [Thioflexithrix psekupsensis]|uniref:Exlusion protein FxsA n=1 Tax=Thioflexithrix psekupsensis TaxID=1570016 RepID=A0A251XCP1_9GAMM|nr:FxsA family protein [Thioflexithrix psekupsensis]OUD15685.1 hypothetical protein TPSD3_03995 [Thioflexithrix psekupsensis]
MSLFQRLLLLFIVVPIVEIYLLISVGKVIGGLPTIGLVILTAVLGAYLLRIQGLATVRKLQRQLEAGQNPEDSLLEGILLLVGGVLLLTPGFFTDALGLFCLLPSTRIFLVRQLKRQIGANSEFNTAKVYPHSTQNKSHEVIEGDYRREKD